MLFRSLTTHYIEEAEEMADRIGVIDKGEIVLVEEKEALMRRLGQTQVTIGLKQPLGAIPGGLERWPLALSEDGGTLSFTQAGESDAGVADLLKQLAANDIDIKAIDMSRSSLEDIFVDLVGKRA